MILAALRQKFRERGAVGFAIDASELAAACAIIGCWSLAMAGASVVAAVVGPPVLALDVLAHPGATSCRNAEEQEPPEARWGENVLAGEGCRNAEEPSCDS